ncbi:MAG: hypothetical protein GPJ54_19205 [Candidatus Heimdallarchaeota archaeon]|nr:hypothetical protein [Candidatus Heimdallarchaeota archaeon]
MFRGEPLALWTMMLGFLSFIMVQILGLVLTGVFDWDLSLVTQAHFFLAYFGWIGLIMLGAQLQFFRAITGLRKYGPVYLRYLYILFLISGLSLIVQSSFNRDSSAVGLGFSIYFVGILIHTYWIVKQSGSKYFKFPLDYFFVSNLFLLVSVFLLILSFYANEYYLLSLSSIRHILSVGWISLTLQGAMVRILPMFVGKSIDRSSKIYLKHHFMYSSVTSTLFILGFISDIDLIIVFTGIAWMISWVWTFVILKRSILKENLEYKQTLLFFVPGMIWSIVGAFFGLYVQFQGHFDNSTNLRAIHIHMSLLLGLTMIMLGAFHRITTFQIYTLLYAGKRDNSISLKQMLKLKRVTASALFFNISVIYMVFGFLDNNYDHVGTGGILILISTILYSTIIFQNFIHYQVNKKSAIPFWLKPTEVSSD